MTGAHKQKGITVELPADWSSEDLFTKARQVRQMTGLHYSSDCISDALKDLLSYARPLLEDGAHKGIYYKYAAEILTLLDTGAVVRDFTDEESRGNFLGEVLNSFFMYEDYNHNRSEAHLLHTATASKDVFRREYRMYTSSCYQRNLKALYGIVVQLRQKAQIALFNQHGDLYSATKQAPGKAWLSAVNQPVETFDWAVRHNSKSITHKRMLYTISGTNGCNPDERALVQALLIAEFGFVNCKPMLLERCLEWRRHFTEEEISHMWGTILYEINSQIGVKDAMTFFHDIVGGHRNNLTVSELLALDAGRCDIWHIFSAGQRKYLESSVQVCRMRIVQKREDADTLMRMVPDIAPEISMEEFLSCWS